MATAQAGGGNCSGVDSGPQNLSRALATQARRRGRHQLDVCGSAELMAFLTGKERRRPLFCRRTEGTVGSSSQRKPPATSSGTVATAGLSPGNPMHPGATQPLRQMQGLVSHLPFEAKGIGGTSPGDVLEAPPHPVHIALCSQVSSVVLWLPVQG